MSDTHLINFAPPGPSIYTGERRCDDAVISSAEDVPCIVSNPPTNQEKNPNPGFTGQTPAFAKANVFEGVEGVTADRPVWYFTVTTANDPIPPPPDPTPFGVFRCNLRCHGVVMSTCFYMGNANETLNQNMNRTTPGGNASDTWCAGGRQQVAPIAVGSAPPQIQKLLAEFGRDLASGRLANGSAGALRQAAADAHRHPDP